MAYRLGIHESVEHAMRRIAREQIRGALRDLGGGADIRPEGVHEARKRCKKLRSMLRLVEPALGRTFVHENAAIRDAARRLSPVRDAHVMLATIDSLQREMEGDHPAAAALRRLRETIEQRTFATGRGDSPSPVDAQPEGIAQFIADVHALEQRVAHWRLHSPDDEAIAPGLKRTYRRARRAMARAIELPSPENLHEWRKHAKHHQYHLRLLLNLWPRMMQVRYDETKELTDTLGLDHDLVMLRNAMTGGAQACAPGSASCDGRSTRPNSTTETLDLAHAADPAHLGHDVQAAVAMIDRRRGELQAEAFPMGRRLFAEKSGEFAARLRRLWRLWRGRAPGAERPPDHDGPGEAIPEIHTVRQHVSRVDQAPHDET